MKKTVLILLVIFAFIGLNAQKVNVAAASNLRYVLEEIKTAYSKIHPNSHVNLIFGASGNLAQQISNGASFDFFMSADNLYPAKLRDKGLTSGALTVYAYGKLVIYSTSLPVDKNGLDLLKDPSIKRIAIANPASAPYGNRAIELLRNLKLYENLRNSIVIAENISQAAQYAFTGNAEIGFVALSLALAPDMYEKGKFYIIPQKSYKPIEQSCVLIKSKIINKEAIRFRNYALSEASKPIWEKWGYAYPVNNKK